MSKQRTMQKESYSSTQPASHGIPKLVYDPSKKRSNIFTIEPILDSYVQQNYATLYDCISSKVLSKIPAPDINKYISVSGPTSTTNTSNEPQPQQLLPDDPEEENGSEDSDALTGDEEYDPSDDDEGDDAETESFSHLPTDFAMKKFEIDYSNYTQRQQSRIDDLSKLFGLLKSIISADSSNKIKSHPKYAQAKKERNGFELWNIMYSTHQISNMYLSEPQQRVEASRKYHSFVQFPHQPLSTYFTEFKSNLRVMKEVGCRLPKTKEVAASFISGLADELYGELKNQLSNACHFNMTQPDDLAAAYALASNYQGILSRPSFSRDRTVMYTSSNSRRPQRLTPSNESSSPSFSSALPHTSNSTSSASRFPSSHLPLSVGSRQRQQPQRKGKPQQQSGTPPQRSGNRNHQQPRPHSSSNGPTCSYCGRSNHKVENCFLKARHVRDANTDYIESDQVAIPDLSSNLEWDVLVVDTSTSSETDLVILDSGAQLSIFRNEDLLYNISITDTPVNINGIGKTSKPISTNKIGFLPGLDNIPIYISSDVKRNILSLADASEWYQAQWDQKSKSFSIHTEDEEFIFERNSNVFTRSFKSCNIDLATVEKNKSSFSSKEIRGAELAREIETRLSHESSGSLIQAIKTGSILGLPITVKDVQNSVKIFGPNIAALKGKSVAKQGVLKDTLEVEKAIEKLQTLRMDIIYIDGDAYLTTLSSPLNYMTAHHLGSGLSAKSTSSLSKILTEVIMKYRGEGFSTHSVLCDNEPALTALEPTLGSFGIKLITAGIKSNHIASLDRAIRLLKDRVRSTLAGLPYVLPQPLLKYLVAFVIHNLNMINHSYSPSLTLSPRELFTGRKTDFNIDVRVAFGAYVQCYQSSSDNTTAERTMGAIALCPTGNVNGSVKFLHLKSGRVISVDHWKELPIPDNIISYMNHQSLKSPKASSRDPTFLWKGRNVGAYIEPASPEEHLPKDLEYREVINLPMPPPHLLLPDQRGENTLPLANGRVVTKTADFEDLEDDDSISSSPPIDSTLATPSAPPSMDPDPPNLPVSLMPNNSNQPSVLEDDPFNEELLPSTATSLPDGLKRVRRPNPKYVNSVSIEEGLKKSPHLVKKAMSEELKQLVDIGAFTPILKEEATKRIIPSKMIVKKKTNSKGEIIKVKARLCAGGHRQERNEETLSSSPTVSKFTILTLCATAANQRREIATADVKGAYLEAFLKTDVFMELDPEISALLVELYPKYQPFLSNGKIVVKLVRALYGCIESALLWYEAISSFLMSLGFNQSVHDECLFIKGIGKDAIHIAVYVDDLFISASKRADIQRIESEMKKRFSDITFNYGLHHEYLGAHLDFSTPGEVTMSMESKIIELIKEHNISGIATTPAANHLMEHRDLPLLSLDKQKMLRSSVAKLLFLSMNTRPDIALPVNYLCTRVERFDDDDLKKFYRILQYLNGTTKLGMTLRCNESLPTIHVYTDAAYGIRSFDRMSQTGVCVTLGSATLVVRSGKQKLVTKSSTEAELVACSDSLVYGIVIKNLLDELRIPHNGITIHQDNMSTINLINNKKSSSIRTKHIDIRYFFIRDRISSGQMKIVHTPTAEMIADLLTKPIQGIQFTKLRQLLMQCK